MTFLPKSGDVDLERRVRHDLAFLFEEHGATVSANSLEAFGNYWNSNSRKIIEIKSFGLSSLLVPDMEYGNYYTSLSQQAQAKTLLL